MKNKKMFIAALLIIIIVSACFIWWNALRSITNIKPSNVSKIEVFNGSTGKFTTITNSTDIEHIIKNLNSVSLKKEKISVGYKGFSFRTTIYKSDGSIYIKFIINSNDTIRKDPFFYRDSSHSIDYNYIKELVNNNPE